MSDVDGHLPFPPEATREDYELLVKLGWQPLDEVAERYRSWIHRAFPRVQLMQPLDASAPDFSVLNERMVRSLTTAHGAEQVERGKALVAYGLRDLEETRWLKETHVAPGLIPLNEGESLLQVIKEQLASAAKARQGFKYQFGNAHSFIAQDFLAHCLLGQTSVGSYVMSALTPTSQMVYVSRSHDNPVPVAKGQSRVAFKCSEVLATFDLAIKSTRDALDESQEADKVEALYRSVHSGVSYEFATAMSRFAALAESEIQISRRSDGGAIERTFAFTPDDAHILRMAAERLASDEPDLEISVVGYITDLSHVPDTPERTVRLMVVRGSIPPRVLRLQLPPDDYKIALEANDKELLVQVSGTMRRENRFSWIHNPGALKIVNDQSDNGQDPLVD